MDDPRTVLFDLDDTILDFSWNQSEAWLTTCREARDATGVDPAALHTAIQQRARDFWSDHDRAEQGRRDLRLASATIINEALSDLGRSAPPDLPMQMSTRYRELREAGMRLFEGATAVLEALRAEGRQLGLVTNGTSEEQRGKIDRFQLEGFFDHIQIEGEFGLGKPHDAAYRHALESLNADPATTWFVGDNLEWDVAAPQRHGIYGIWVDVRATGLPEGSHTPDRVVQRITDLL